MRPVPHPDRSIALPPRLCGGIEVYAAAWDAGSSGMDWDVRFDKRQKLTHRFTIADTRGRLDLTVPIAKPHSSKVLWSDIRISDHGLWWDVHRVSLESAYGRTPYFEFYIDRFLPMLTPGVTERYPLLRDLAMAWDAQIRDILGLGDSKAGPEAVTDEELTHIYNNKVSLVPYRQVRQQALGFIPGLSVLDLIFNLGPEAQIYLSKLRAEG